MTKLTENAKEEIVREVHAGGKMTAVARAHGVTVGRVSQIVKEHHKGSSSATEEVTVDYNGNVVPIKAGFKAKGLPVLTIDELEELRKKMEAAKKVHEDWEAYCAGHAPVKKEGEAIKYGDF